MKYPVDPQAMSLTLLQFPLHLSENLGLLTAATHSFCQLQVLVDQQEGSGDWLSIRDRIGMLILLQTVTFSILILCHVDI